MVWYQGAGIKLIANKNVRIGIIRTTHAGILEIDFFQELSLSKVSDECESTVECTLFPAIINLNVGGRQYTTHLSTLTKDPNSMLAAMFSGRHPVSKDQNGCYFIDVAGDIFAHILNYLRFEKLPPIYAALEVYDYAVYFGIQSLVEEMKCFESVILHTYSEKEKAYYPKYKENLKEIAANLERIIAETPTHIGSFQLQIYDSRQYPNRRVPGLYYRSHPKDNYGQLFGRLIVAEFRKRGVNMLAIQYLQSGTFQLTCGWDLNQQTIHDKMLNALCTIADRIH